MLYILELSAGAVKRKPEFEGGSSISTRRPKSNGNLVVYSYLEFSVKVNFCSDLYRYAKLILPNKENKLEIFFGT